MEDLFNTFDIVFKKRSEFNQAIEMNNLAIDIGHADMILKYDRKFHRDRFAGFLATNGFTSLTLNS